MNKRNVCFRYEQRIQTAYKKLRTAYTKVRHSYAEMIFRFALIAEYKDESTGIHLVRVADYCTEIAQQLKVKPRDIDDLRYASPMHDIGKLVIPDAILKKQGGLTPEEREVIRKHTLLGADIFKGTHEPILRIARTISLTHHERYDGTGYPYGLKGKDIPLFGRIVAIADVFDALTSDRPYKKAFDFDRAIEIIKAESGKQFDPVVVRAFLKRINNIKKIWQATKDIDLFVSERCK